VIAETESPANQEIPSPHVMWTYKGRYGGKFARHDQNLRVALHSYQSSRRPRFAINNPSFTEMNSAQLSACLLRLHACQDQDELIATSTSSIRTFIECDLISYNDIDQESDSVVVRTDPYQMRFEELYSYWEKWKHQHPVLQYVASTGDGAPKRISDFIDRPQLHRLELYQSVFKHTKTEFQLCTSFQLPRQRIIGFALNRHEQDFTDEDCHALSLLTPHIELAHSQLSDRVMCKAERDGLAMAGNSIGRMTMIIDQHGEIIEWITGETLYQQVAAAAAVGSRDRRDQSLDQWLKTWAVSISASDEHGLSSQFTVAQSVLTARCLRRLEHGSSLVLLITRTLRREPSWLKVTFNLTSRQAEVLSWLCEGRSNAAIAIMLGLSIGTVKKHVEMIFTKLSVDSRSAAIATVLQREN
jgi:DNA-binding CsgD family transcriptional regulator